MPIRATCKHSGAILFIPTPEEASAKVMAEQYEDKLKTLDNKLSEIDDIKQELLAELRKVRSAK